jgi:predicted nucleic acid-binding protein
MQGRKKIRIYVDTSVYGGVFDDEFDVASQRFFNQVKRKEFILVTSAVVQEELKKAPGDVRSFFLEMLPYSEITEITQESLDLRKANLKAGIVSTKYANDALHVAMATIAGCDIILSWNFKHIVHFDKIPLYNAVNILNGLNPISIFSPMEVIKYD